MVHNSRDLFGTDVWRQAQGDFESAKNARIATLLGAHYNVEPILALEPFLLDGQKSPDWSVHDGAKALLPSTLKSPAATKLNWILRALISEKEKRRKKGT